MRYPKLDRRTLVTGAASAATWFAAGASRSFAQAGSAAEAAIVSGVEAAAEPLPEIGAAGFANFVDRFAEAKVVLLGESTHGTDEFYRARAAMTERLVKEHGFTIVAVETDWPDAARIDAYIRGRAEPSSAFTPFQRFPVWMWRNRAVRDFVDRLHAINGAMEQLDRRAGFYGLDLYSLPSSMEAVLEFVEHHDPDAVEEVRARYECLEPWVDDPGTYGALARTSELDSCAEKVVSVIDELLKQRLALIEASDRALFDALQNARVVAASEAYYRAMYEGPVASWNLRDTHMFETLQAIFAAHGPGAKAVVWAHNSHIGDAAATAMGRRGEINIGHLCRREYGEKAVLIGFGTDRGTVTAADEWGGPTRTKSVRPSIPGSWGAIMREVPLDRFLLDIRSSPDLAEALGAARPERFIGVIYRPETERVSHYADAALAHQFDAYLWFEETQSIEPLRAGEIEAMPATYPFAL